jgi:hypothetical protein
MSAKIEDVPAECKTVDELIIPRLEIIQELLKNKFNNIFLHKFINNLINTKELIPQALVLVSNDTKDVNLLIKMLKEILELQHPGQQNYKVGNHKDVFLKKDLYRKRLIIFKDNGVDAALIYSRVHRTKLDFAIKNTNSYIIIHTTDANRIVKDLNNPNFYILKDE